MKKRKVGENTIRQSTSAEAKECIVLVDISSNKISICPKALFGIFIKRIVVVF